MSQLEELLTSDFLWGQEAFSSTKGHDRSGAYPAFLSSDTGNDFTLAKEPKRETILSFQSSTQFKAAWS